MTLLHFQMSEDKNRREQRGERDRNRGSRSRSQSPPEFRRELNLRLVLTNSSRSLENNRLQLQFNANIPQPGIHVTCGK